MKPDYASAWHDLYSGFTKWHIWTRLGWQEVKRRYRRTVLGPFWATMSIGMFIGGMAFIWAPLFRTSVTDYLPFLAAGLVAWTYTTSLITEGCTTYTASEGLIKQLSFPFSILNYMVVWRNIIVFFHNLVIVALVNVVLPVDVTWATLLFIPGILIVALNGLWITILLGMLSARFRDIPPLIGNLVTIMMFVTPVFWRSEQLGPNAQRYIDLNFMYHLIEVIRAPLLGHVPALLSYWVTLAGVPIGAVVTFAVYARFRSRIAYWL